MGARLLNLNQQLVAKDKKIMTMHSEVKEMRDDLNNKITAYAGQISELEEMTKAERLAKEEWAVKYTGVATELSKRDEQQLSHEEKIKMVEMDRDQTNIKIESLLRTLQAERAEREAFEKEAARNLEEVKKSEVELQLTLQVSRQLEVQRKQ